MTEAHGLETRSNDCPECRNGKHQNCDGVALDPDADEIVECGCAQDGHA